MAKFALLPHKPPRRCYVAIDPGISTGLAVQDTVARTPMATYTLDFWRTCDFLAELRVVHGEALCVVLEDPNLNKAIYARFDGVTGASRTKIAQNVGANKRDAQLLLEFCQRQGIEVRTSKPLGKVNAATFHRLTGIVKCSQHARDAGCLLLAYVL